MPVFNNALAGAAGSAGGAAAGYKIERSLRFNPTDTPKLQRTPSTAGNRKTWTFSCWVKRTGQPARDQIISAPTPARSNGYIEFQDDQLMFEEYGGGQAYINVRTSRVFRDPSAWYHIVVAVDTTQATASNRVKIYVNGVQETSFAVSTYPSQNYDTSINNNTEHKFSQFPGNSNFPFDGLLAECHMVDGQQLAPTDFGEFDADTGVWNPIEYTGTYSSTFSTEMTSISSGNIFPANGTSTLNALDGSTSTALDCRRGTHASTTSIRFTPSPAITGVTKIRVWAPFANKYQINGGGYQTFSGTSNWTEIYNGSSISLTTLDVIRDSGNSGSDYGHQLHAIEINDVILTRDGSNNSFHLNFSNNSSNAALGTDSSGNNNTWSVINLTAAATTFTQTSVANATGGLPILNTTDTYGNSMGSGDRSDPLASNLQWAVPLGHNGARDFYDKAITNRTSGVRHISGNPGSHSTSISNFYGGSLYMSGGASGSFSTDVWNSISSANSQFTFEFWVYLVSTTQTDGYGSTIFSSRSAGNNGAGWFDIGFGGISGNKPKLRLQVSQGWDFNFNFDGSNNNAAFPSGKWIHVAVTRDGSNNVRLFGNGILLQTQSSGVGITSISRGLFGGHSYGSYASHVNYHLQDVRVYNTCKYTSSFNPPYETTTTLNPENIDSLLDSPSNYEASSGNNGGNYCTMNPLAKGPNCALSNGNLDITTQADPAKCLSTIGMSSGKWYSEFTCTNNSPNPGLATSQTDLTSGFLGNDAYGWVYGANGKKYHNDPGASGVTYGDSYTTGDVIGVAFDADAGTLTFYKEGVSQGAAYTGLTSGPYFFATGGSYSSSVANFGQRPFAHTPPTGYKALCTQNFDDPLIKDPSTAFDVKTWQGNGVNSARTISGYNFSPDLVWGKSRTAGYRHLLYDTVRGVGKDLRSDTTATEGTNDQYGYLSAFNSDGFTTSSGSTDNDHWNHQTKNYVAWAWDAGTAFSNASGSNGATMASSGKANQNAGISIVTYSYTGTGQYSYVHGLNVKPDLVIRKARNLSEDWSVYHGAMGFDERAHLNNTNASSGTTTFRSDQGNPTSALNYINNNNTSNVVEYVFAAVPGFSSFGRYEGNGIANGPFIYTGFRPRFILLKNVDNYGTGYDWFIHDTARDPVNTSNDRYIKASQADAEQTYEMLDILSNGFKIRNTLGSYNLTQHTHVYAAFAENPFKYARAF
tara:strand:+ start:894 stop:4514 length:3621 start_codon:yes stop_codon:yes gene_type:complete